MSMLMTVWHEGSDQTADMFLGEVLLDLASVDVRGTVIWYDLQEHDLNCSSVPLLSPKIHSTSQTAAVNRTTVLRSVSNMSKQSSKDSSGRNTASPDLISTNIITTAVLIG